jgi:hypothetical protein
MEVLLYCVLRVNARLESNGFPSLWRADMTRYKDLVEKERCAMATQVNFLAGQRSPILITPLSAGQAALDRRYALEGAGWQVILSSDIAAHVSSVSNCIVILSPVALSDPAVTAAINANFPMLIPVITEPMSVLSIASTSRETCQARHTCLGHMWRQTLQPGVVRSQFRVRFSRQRPVSGCLDRKRSYPRTCYGLTAKT